MSTFLWIVIAYVGVGFLTAAVVSGLCRLTARGTSVPWWGWRKEVAWNLRAALLWPFLVCALVLGAIIYFAAAITVGNLVRTLSNSGYDEQRESSDSGDDA